MEDLFDTITGLTQTRRLQRRRRKQRSESLAGPALAEALGGRGFSESYSTNSSWLDLDHALASGTTVDESEGTDLNFEPGPLEFENSGMLDEIDE